MFAVGALMGYLVQLDWSPLLRLDIMPQTASVVEALSLETGTEGLSMTQRVNQLSLEEKVGQLFMIGHWSEDYYQHTDRMLKLYGFGGIIIMNVSDDSVDSVPLWTASWQKTSAIPLLISIDQEGGVVSRIKAPGYTQTSQRSLGTTDEAYTIGTKRGQELRELGINTNLAPVIDYASTSDAFLYNRSFATSTEVSSMASALINGHADAGVLAIPKHFPGHESTPDDSHFVMPVIDITAAAFPEYVQPFRDVLDAADINVLMTAHVQFPKLDDEYPVTLSYEILTRQLRRELGFEGVIITDDMTMGAITNQWPADEAAVRAIQAGADILLFAAEPNVAMEARDRILEAVAAGDITEDRIDESVTRILELKQKQGLLE